MRLSTVMRIGIALGLATTIAGLCAKALRAPGSGIATMIGILTVISTPVASLIAIAITHARRDRGLCILALITVATMLISVLTSLTR